MVEIAELAAGGARSVPPRLLQEAADVVLAGVWRVVLAGGDAGRVVDLALQVRAGGDHAVARAIELAGLLRELRQAQAAAPALTQRPARATRRA